MAFGRLACCRKSLGTSASTTRLMIEREPADLLWSAGGSSASTTRLMIGCDLFVFFTEITGTKLPQEMAR